MYKLISVVKKNPALSADEFWTAWQEEHAPHVLAQPQVKGYRINAAISRPGHTPAFDGVAEIWVESLNDLAALQKARVDGPLAKSRAKLTQADETRTIVTEERVILPEPPAGSAELKLCELVYRRPDLTFDRFNQHWAEVHPGPVTKLTGLLGYIQHPARQDGDPPAYDGHVMVWFDTLENARQSLRSPEGAEVLADEKNFIDPNRLERVAVREMRLR